MQEKEFSLGEPGKTRRRVCEWGWDDLVGQAVLGGWEHLRKSTEAWKVRAVWVWEGKIIPNEYITTFRR